MGQLTLAQEDSDARSLRASGQLGADTSGSSKASAPSPDGRRVSLEVDPLDAPPPDGRTADATVAELMRPLWADLLALCVLPAAGAAPRAGGFRRLRPPWAAAPPPADDDASSAELRDHFMYCAFKKSHRKRYERKVGGDRPLLLSG